MKTFDAIESELWSMVSPNPGDFERVVDNHLNVFRGYDAAEDQILDAIAGERIIKAAMLFESLSDNIVHEKETNERLREVFAKHGWTDLTEFERFPSAVDSVFEDTVMKASTRVLHTKYPSGQKYPTPPRTYDPSVKEANDLKWRLWGVAYDKTYDKSDYGEAIDFYNLMIDHAIRQVEKVKVALFDGDTMSAAMRFSSFVAEYDTIKAIRDRLLAHRVYKRADIDEIMTVLHNTVEYERDVIEYTISAIHQMGAEK